MNNWSPASLSAAVSWHVLRLCPKLTALASVLFVSRSVGDTSLVLDLSVPLLCSAILRQVASGASTDLSQ